MKKYFSISYIKENILIIIVGIISGVLRFINLGYSDFQGDEIKALYLPTQGEGFFSYIMDQRKGPIQFIITYILKLFDPGYNTYFFLRIPFAIAGFLSVIYFYKLVKLHFNKKIAFYSSLFFATNGFFIAFSRIIQYQSFVILFMILCLYFLSLAGKYDQYKYKGIFWGLIFWSISLLSHYDGFFIFPFVSYLIFKWFKNSNLEKVKKIKLFVISGFMSALLVLSFYIPFLLSLSGSTLEYWSGRISGDVSGKISSSRYLFTVYQPIYSIHIYVALFTLGVAFILSGLLSEKILKIKKLPQFIRDFFTHTTEIMEIIKKDKIKILALFLWFGITYAFFEFFVYISGTHIYTYLVSAFIFLAFGLVTLESIVFKIFELQLVKIFNFLGVLVLFLFLASQSYAVFVDNYREYPWEEEDFLVWRFPKPNPMFHVSSFGFPYYRNWRGIRDFINSHPEIYSYNTNEKNSISRYYVRLEKDTDKSGFYIHIKDPQSFTGDIPHEKGQYWSSKYSPVFTLTRYGRAMVNLYIMEQGSLEEIIEKGF
ncbi:glycosyltransferase family 39 protein [Patescibacteria group bacterium]|nr:glycosyltransferase family 39 protein [Patescibacteria group bacterium]